MNKIFFAMALVAAFGLTSCGNKQCDKSKDCKDSTATEEVKTAETAVADEPPAAEPAAELKEGEAAPDFTLKNVEGNDVSLSSLKGKYVVVDFWGTWCPWCVKGIPDMKASYEKYSDKMEILSVDCGDTETDWKDAVKEHQMTWTNVIDTEKNPVSELYGVDGFPTKIVVDPEGKVAKVVVGEDPAFYTYLDELFK